MREGRRVFREGNSLLIKVGVIMRALALALVIAAVVVSVTLGSESGRVAAVVARKALREVPPNSSGTQEESQRSPSLPDEPVRQRKEDDKEPVAAAFEPERSNSGSEMPRLASQQTPLERDLQPQEPQSANAARHYELLPGAIMGLTIRSMGIYNAPVFDSDSQWALPKGSPISRRPPCLGHRVL